MPVGILESELVVYNRSLSEVARHPLFIGHTGQRRIANELQSPNYRAAILKSMETLKIKMAPVELDSLVRDATEKGMSPWESLDRFLKSPANQRVQRSIERRIANAGLPMTATM